MGVIRLDPNDTYDPAKDTSGSGYGNGNGSGDGSGNGNGPPATADLEALSVAKAGSTLRLEQIHTEIALR